MKTITITDEDAATLREILLRANAQTLGSLDARHQYTDAELDKVRNWVRVGNEVADAAVARRDLKQGDVKLHDRVRLEVVGTLGREGSGFVEGNVYETASDGGVIGVKVGGVWFSAGLPFVELLS